MTNKIKPEDTLIQIRSDNFNGVKYYKSEADFAADYPFIVIRPTVKLQIMEDGIYDESGRILQDTVEDKLLFETFRNDSGFIYACQKLDSKHLAVDGAHLDNDGYINSIVFNPETLVALVRTQKGILEYCMFTNLSKSQEHEFLGYDFYRSIHGMVRSRDSQLNKTPLYYRKVRKYNILKKILDEYFCKYPDIICIDADVPEFLRDRRILKTKKTDDKKTEIVHSGFKKLPLHHLLVEAGFINPYKPKQMYVKKNNKPCGLFNYQITKNWFLKDKAVQDGDIRRILQQ